MSRELTPYKPGRKIYELVFEDFPGMEVHATGTSMGQLLDLNTQERENVAPNRLREMLQTLAEHILVWNLVHPDLKKGQEECARFGLPADAPMPTEVHYMLCLDHDVLLAILWGWVGKLSRVSLPKELNSLNGNNEKMSAMMKMLGDLQNQSQLPVPNLS